MKKIISLLAVCALLATTLFALSAQATPYTEYPYIYEDLENGTPANFGLLSNSTGAVHGVKADPTGRSGYVYGVSIAPKDANYSFVEAVKIQDIPVVMGSTMKSSLMVYMATGTPRTNNVSVIYSLTGTTLTADGEKSDQTFNGWYEQPATINWTPGTWQKIESKVTWSKDLAYGVSGSTPLNGNTIDYDSIKIYRVLFRIGASSNAAFIVDETKLVDGADSLDFYFDEMVYEPYYQTIEDTNLRRNLLAYGDFENGKTTGFYAHNDAGVNKFLVSTKTENGNTYLNMANPDGLFAWNELEYNGAEHANIYPLPNRMYEFTFRYRVNEMYDANKTCGTATGAKGADVYFKWGVGNGTGTNEKIDLNGLYASSNWPTSKYPVEDMILLDGQWHEAKINFHFDAKTFAKPVKAGVPFRVRIVFQAHQSNMWMPMHMDMDMDDIQLIDCGPITNGSFEQASGYSVRWLNQQGAGATVNNTGYDVYGWIGDGATISSSDEVREGSDSTKSMLVQLNAGGRPLQALSLDPAESKYYKLSFWAKDATIADGESVPFALVLDRTSKAGTQSNEVYKVPDYEFYTGTYEKVSGGWIYNENIMDTQQWRMTNEWQYFETYIYSEFPFISGKENAASNLILPRQPFMYFLYNGSNPAGATYYLDDVKIEKAHEPVPEASGFKVNGVANPGEKLTVSYNFADPAGHEEGASIVRVYDENGASFGSFKARGGSYTVPEQAIGKKLTFVLSPVDAEGNAGAKVSAVAETTEDWVKMFVGADFKSARLYAGKAMSGKILFASYNGKELISVDDVDVTVTEAGTLVPVSATQDFDLTDATYVKVFFWNGLTDVVPLTTAVKADIK
ncbi:MAG: hypothetical protein IJC78_05545 [Clostridia bacterium]|nr:hypothetical protein [Clostridia bacterium]